MKHYLKSIRQVKDAVNLGTVVYWMNPNHTVEINLEGRYYIAYKGDVLAALSQKVESETEFYWLDSTDTITDDMFDAVIDGEVKINSLSQVSLSALIVYIGKLESIGGTHERLTATKDAALTLIS